MLKISGKYIPLGNIVRRLDKRLQSCSCQARNPTDYGMQCLRGNPLHPFRFPYQYRCLSLFQCRKYNCVKYSSMSERSKS